MCFDNLHNMNFENVKNKIDELFETDYHDDIDYDARIQAFDDLKEYIDVKIKVLQRKKKRYESM